MEAIENEFCPSCGRGVDELDPSTGWCLDCIGKRRCENCDRIFKPDQNSRIFCRSCRQLNLWLSRNADDIERRMATENIIAAEAILRIKQEKPRCVVCDDVIKAHGGRREKGKALFCGKDECRRAGIRYTNYRKRNNLSDEKALEKALNGILGRSQSP